MKAIKYFLFAMVAVLAISCSEEPILRDGGDDDDDDPIVIGGGGGTGQPGGGPGGSGNSGGRMSSQKQMPKDSVFRVKL